MNKRGEKMSFYTKEISKINFAGIKYRKINNINDYFLMEKEVRELISCGDKKQFWINAENLKNSAIEEKEISINACFPLVSSFLFSIGAFALGFISAASANDGICEFITKYIVAVITYLIIIVIIVRHYDIIIKVRNKKITFYKTICEMIKANN